MSTLTFSWQGKVTLPTYIVHRWRKGPSENIHSFFFLLAPLLYALLCLFLLQLSEQFYEKPFNFVNCILVIIYNEIYWTFIASLILPLVLLYWQYWWPNIWHSWSWTIYIHVYTENVNSTAAFSIWLNWHYLEPNWNKRSFHYFSHQLSGWNLEQNQFQKCF